MRNLGHTPESFFDEHLGRQKVSVFGIDHQVRSRFETRAAKMLNEGIQGPHGYRDSEVRHRLRTPERCSAERGFG
jgi:hypothetical protein